MDKAAIIMIAILLGAYSLGAVFALKRKSLRTYTWNVVRVVFLLYLFLVAISLMGHAFKSLAKGDMLDLDYLLQHATENPLIALFIGIFVTAVAQSSSFTTSLVVGLVAAGSLPIHQAVPIIMGANIGTTVTNTLVSMGHITRKDEFRRAFASATLHDFFNQMTVLVMLPTELITRAIFGIGVLEWLARDLSGVVVKVPGFGGKSPIKRASAWGADQVEHVLAWLYEVPVVQSVVGWSRGVVESIGSWFKGAEYAVQIDYTALVFNLVMAVLSLAMIFAVLYFMVKVLKKVFVGRIENALNSAIFKNPLTAMGTGAACTAVVQSSSITTSLMVPLVGSGIVKLKKAFPFILGANLGTTVTALLASLATGVQDGLTIALVHLLFNILGILVFFPMPWTRRLPLGLAQWFGNRCAEHRWFAVTYVIVMFFIVPGILIWLFH